MQFLHAAAGYPVASTWINAIKKGYYISWPGLTAENVRKHLTKSTITSRGHFEQQRKNLRSTKISDEEDLNIPPTQDTPNVWSHQ
eukprot:4786387-Ditylum_brightwellii.AAC.1